MDAVIERFHDDRDTGETGETTGALDTNADADELEYTAADLEGRIQITAKWYDDLGRLEDVVRYGTYGGSDFDRDALSVPARSDTALRTTYAFEGDGDSAAAFVARCTIALMMPVMCSRTMRATRFMGSRRDRIAQLTQCVQALRAQPFDA
jgi:hypothetical protein